MDIWILDNTNKIEAYLIRPQKLKNQNYSFISAKSLLSTMKVVVYSKKFHCYFPEPLKVLTTKELYTIEKGIVYVVGIVNSDTFGKYFVIGIPGKGYTLAGKRTLHNLTMSKIKELVVW